MFSIHILATPVPTFFLLWMYTNTFQDYHPNLFSSFFWQEKTTMYSMGIFAWHIKLLATGWLESVRLLFQDDVGFVVFEVFRGSIDEDYEDMIHLDEIKRKMLMHYIEHYLMTGIYRLERIEMLSQIYGLIRFMGLFYFFLCMVSFLNFHCQLHIIIYDSTYFGLKICHSVSVPGKHLSVIKIVMPFLLF
ncbi:hypothetical protein ACJX0J_005364 [Zea mays]